MHESWFSEPQRKLFLHHRKKKKNERVINMHIENNASGQIRLEP